MESEIIAGVLGILFGSGLVLLVRVVIRWHQP